MTAAAAAPAPAAAVEQQQQQLGERVRLELKDAHSFLFFDDAGTVLASSFQVGWGEAPVAAAATQGPPRRARQLARCRALQCSAAACICV